MIHFGDSSAKNRRQILLHLYQRMMMKGMLYQQRQLVMRMKWYKPTDNGVSTDVKIQYENGDENDKNDEALKISTCSRG